MTASPPLSSIAPVYPTFGDVLAQIGDIPPERILTHPPPGVAVEADVLAAETRGRLCELVAGVLIEKAMCAFESQLGITLAYLLRKYLEDNPLGAVFGESGMVRMASGNIRIPDLSFYRWERFPGGDTPEVAINTVAPNLAIEILSASNTPGEMRRKVTEYFASGTQLVWLIDAANRSARVFDTSNEGREINLDGTLDGGDILPGFCLRLGEVFEKTRR